MKINLTSQRSILILSAPFIAVSSIGVASTSVLPTFTNFSRTELLISNFSLLPRDVGADTDINAISIAEIGVVEVQLEGDTTFVSDQSSSIALGRSVFQTSISGTGLDYLGRADIRSNLMGRFDIPANTNFRFDIHASALLINSTDNLVLSPVSTSAGINLAIQDVLNQRDWDIFNFLGVLNTNAIDDRDLFEFKASPNLTIFDDEEETLVNDNNAEETFVDSNEEEPLFNGNEEETFVDSNNEALQFSLTASFQIPFSEPTELVLLAETSSCNYGSNLIDVCVSVPEPSSGVSIPEPSNRLGLIAGIVWLSSVLCSSRIVKRIVQLTR